MSKNGTAALNGGGDVILASHSSTLGPGGQSKSASLSRSSSTIYLFTDSESSVGVILDADGPLMVYAYSADQPKTYHIGLNRLDFGSGWPIVL